VEGRANAKDNHPNQVPVAHWCRRMSNVRERTDAQPMLLTVEEAAQKLQISRSLLYEEMRRRRVRVVKIRHLTRIRQSELERYVRDCEVEGL